MGNLDLAALSYEELERLAQIMSNEQSDRQKPISVSPYSGITTSSSESGDDIEIVKITQIKPNTTFVQIRSAQQVSHELTVPNNAIVNYATAVARGESKGNEDSRVSELNRFFLNTKSAGLKKLNPPQRDITPPRFRETESARWWKKINNVFESNNGQTRTLRK